ncbi:zinc finger protein ZAT9-like [Hibiscus syriacus]|uniref:Zinc finger protein ZAT9-like n=1 Tax=Hibiscus syriacus TaxID=106335 RepID=A0A6A3A5U0_HIBSY|nr:zinc finger protein ZAT9-like [Hibiscus syriacus]
MRTHGIRNESQYIDDDDTVNDWEDNLGGNIVPPDNTPIYGLRTYPNRLKSCRVCENCGKEFFSWNSFLEHGKCSSRDAESLGSSRGSDGYDNGVTRRGSVYLSKRKRLLISDFASNEELEVANCLMMLSNATVVVPFVTEPEESCTSASKEEERRNTMSFITPIAYDSIANDDHDAFPPIKSTPTFRVGTLASTSKKKSKVHECSICCRIFSSGQALGGHKRCHWITSNPPADHTSSFFKLHRFQDNVNQIQQTQKSRFVGDFEPLDLNLPASTNELIGPNHIDRSSFDVSPRVYLQPWIAKEKEDNQQQLQVDNNDTIKNNICHSSKQDEEAKTGSTMMLAKLSELKDVNMSGSSFPWLQVGIVSSSTTNVGSDP